MVPPLKLSHWIGSLFTALTILLGSVLTFWVDTTARLEKAEEAIKHTNELTNQRLNRIERGVDRIETAIFTFNSNPNQSNHQNPQ